MAKTSRKSYAVVNADWNTIGTVYRLERGPHKGLWFFVSHTTAHKGSRRGWATADRAGPRWAKKAGGKLV